MTEDEKDKQNRLAEMVRSYRVLSSHVEQALVDGDLISVYEAFKPLFIAICFLVQDIYEINTLEDFIKTYKEMSIIRNAQDNTTWN